MRLTKKVAVPVLVTLIITGVNFEIRNLKTSR
jgi:hypothetical protein